MKNILKKILSKKKVIKKTKVSKKTTKTKKNPKVSKVRKAVKKTKSKKLLKNNKSKNISIKKPTINAEKRGKEAMSTQSTLNTIIKPGINQYDSHFCCGSNTCNT